MSYLDYLDVNGKTYWKKDGEIISTEKNGFGDVVTHRYDINTIWPQLHDIFSEGRKSKAKEIKRAFESF